MRDKNMVAKKSTYNIFEDLGFDNPDEALAKSKLIIRIDKLIRGRKLTQAQAAKVLGITQSNVSRLVNGHLGDFSIERLVRFIRLLGRDVEIRILEKPIRRKAGRLTVKAA